MILLTPFAVVVTSNPHFAYSLRSYTSTHFFEDETRGAVATRKGAPSTRQEYEVAGALCFFCTNAPSGIMRRRRLMCESRVLPCPKGSAVWQKGETREEGGHILRGVRTQLVKKALNTSAFLDKVIRDLARFCYLF